MKERPLTKREKAVRRHNVASLIAFVSLVTTGIGSLFADLLSHPIFVVAFISMFLAILVMFATRNADEYIATIWQSGTSAALLVLVAFMVFAPFRHGFVEGMINAELDTSFAWERWGPPLALFAFFVASGWARVRGT